MIDGRDAHLKCPQTIGAIVGIVLGGLCFLVIVAGVIIFLTKKKKQNSGVQGAGGFHPQGDIAQGAQTDSKQPVIEPIIVTGQPVGA